MPRGDPLPSLKTDAGARGLGKENQKGRFETPRVNQGEPAQQIGKPCYPGGEPHRKGPDQSRRASGDERGAMRVSQVTSISKGKPSK